MCNVDRQSENALGGRKPTRRLTSRRIKELLGAAIGLVLVLVVVPWLQYWLTSPPPPAFTEVPSVKHLSEAAAVAALKDDGFSVQVESLQICRSKGAPSFVIDQDPASGKAHTGSVVQLLVNGPTDC